MLERLYQFYVKRLTNCFEIQANGIFFMRESIIYPKYVVSSCTSECTQEKMPLLAALRMLSCLLVGDSCLDSIL